MREECQSSNLGTDTPDAPKVRRPSWDYPSLWGKGKVGIPDSVQAKLDRSAVHLQSVQDTIVEYLNSCPSRLACEYNIDTRALTLLEKPPAPKMSLAVLVGDAIHNLRSSLDLLACELAHRPGRHTCMPVLKTPPTDKQGNPIPVKVSGGVGAPVLDEVTRGQPFQYGENYAIHWLWILNEMWNADKHRLLLTSPAWLNNSWIAHGNAMGVVPGIAQMWGATADAAEYTFLPLDTSVDMKGHFSIQVAFDQKTPVPTQGVMETLGWLDDETRGFVARLTSL